MRVRPISSRWRWLMAGGLLLCAGLSTAADWKRGIEHQRIADQGDGSFLNPVLAGDHPDPSVLKDGDDYYLTLSS
ncbi:xylosidase, partial [Xanthomonas perforans]|nr:xylosidase [Xanthomonas perforans]